MGKDIKKVIVVSAINIVDGGAYTILKECLEGLSSGFSCHYDIIVLVHKTPTFQVQNITYIEFPASKSSWFLRIYYEYFYFAKFSAVRNVYLWLSLHDITPNVKANIRAVYCHNPSPFYNMSFKEVHLEPKLFLFSKFYKWLYKINLDKNDYIIVQQNWMREYFLKLSQKPRVLVAHPSVYNAHPLGSIKPDESKNNQKVFFFPSFPRVFKNFEIICEAVLKLNNSGYKNFDIYLTLSGDLNKYDQFLYKNYGHIPNIHFIGLLSRNQVFEFYEKADCLIFPSKLETWGMPLTEFKDYNKTILAADLPYAHETVGNYERVIYFNPDEPESLAFYMGQVLMGSIASHYHQPDSVAARPDTESWPGLFNLILTPWENKK
jgi:glycosyltransferase involved in cell wall biosynthesis